MEKLDDQTTYKLQLLRYYLGCLITFGTCCAGVAGNGIAFTVLNRMKPRSSTQIYLIALAITDTIMLSLVATLLGFGLTLRPEPNDMFKQFNRTYVHLFPTVQALIITFQCVSVWQTLGFTVDRYIMICHPYSAARMCSNRRAINVTLLLYVGGAIYGLPRFFQYHTVPYNEWLNDSWMKSHGNELTESNSTAILANVTDFSNKSMTSFALPFDAPTHVNDLTSFGDSGFFRNAIQIGGYFVFQCGVPFLAIAFLNYKLFRAVQAAKKDPMRVNQTSEQRRIDTNVMLIAVVVIFIICQIPALVSNFMGAIDPRASYKVSGAIIHEIANYLVVLNSAINIFPYYLFSRQFRRTLIKMLLGATRSESVLTPTNPLRVKPMRRAATAASNIDGTTSLLHTKHTQRNKSDPNLKDQNNANLLGPRVSVNSETVNNYSEGYAVFEK